MRFLRSFRSFHSFVLEFAVTEFPQAFNEPFDQQDDDLADSFRKRVKF